MSSLWSMVAKMSTDHLVITCLKRIMKSVSILQIACGTGSQFSFCMKKLFGLLFKKSLFILVTDGTGLESAF